MARLQGEKNVLLGWLYDHVLLEQGQQQNQARFFQVPVGQAIPGTNVQKTYSHTNLRTTGFLGSIKTFTITSFYLSPPPFMRSENVDAFIRGYAAFWVNDTYYPDYFTLNMFIGGSQWRESVRGQAAAPDTRAFTGDGRQDNILKNKRPYLVTIDSFENSYMEVKWDTPGYTPNEDQYVGCVIFGRSERPVG